jgi:hypothetical protein
MRILALFITLSEGLLFDIEGRYTAFSGIVTKIELGGQSVTVQLDFSEPISYIIPKDICPAFVDNCFDSRLSPGFREDTTPRVMKGGNMMGIEASDSLIVGTRLSFHPRFRFTYVTDIFCDSPKGFEAAGSIGASTRAALFVNKVVELKDIGSRFSMKELHEHVVNPTRTITVPKVHEGWMFPAALATEGEDINLLVPLNLVQYDPSEEFLVVPEAMRESFLENFPLVFSQSEEGQIRIPCKPTENANELRLMLDTGDYIELQHDQLVIPPVSEELCVSRIKFSTETLHVVIGRILTRSVSGVVLDYARGLITFGPNEDSKLPFAESSPLIPVFAYPEMEEDRIVLPWITEADKKDGLVAFRIEPTTTFEADNMHVQKYQFVRTLDIPHNDL